MDYIQWDILIIQQVDKLDWRAMHEKLIKTYVNRALDAGIDMSREELTAFFTELAERADKVFEEPVRKYREEISKKFEEVGKCSYQA